MKKNAVLICMFLSFFFVSHGLFAQSVLNSFELMYLGSIRMHPEFSKPLAFDTYEDIDGVTLIPRVEKMPISFITVDDIPTGTISSARANAFLASLHPYVVISNCTNEQEFIDKYFFLDGGHMHKDKKTKIEEWRELIATSFPYTYTIGLNTPHHRYFYLCIRPGYRYIVNPRLTPNASNCQFGTCNCPRVRNDADEWVVQHRWHYNMHTNFRGRFLATAVNAQEYKEPSTEYVSSGVGFSLNLHDRTPPTIGSGGPSFPTQEGKFSATTGDIYIPRGIVIKDNSAARVGYVLTTGKIINNPEPNWRRSEVWNADLRGEIGANTHITSPFIPNKNHGFMRYSVFAWDEDWNLNRTESDIKEDVPGIGYNSVGVPDLKGTMFTAQQFPRRIQRADKPESLIDINFDQFDCNNRVSEGYIKIIDNDLPNIAIRISSKKNPNDVFYFPPVSNPSNLGIYNSSSYSGSNASDYAKFIAKSHNTMFRHEVLNGNNDLPLYYKVVKANPKQPVTPGDKNIPEEEKRRFEKLLSSSSSFVRKNVRLENYLTSDTDEKALMISSDSKFGERHGTGGEMSAYMLMDESFATWIQEDVEYSIDIWVDDNVKWANIDGSTVLDRALFLPTGVVSASLRVNIPNQYPTYDRTLNFPEVPTGRGLDKAINGDMRVVFREPTPKVKIRSEDDLLLHKFPYIEATAEDYSGLKRTIRLYLKVNDESANIRTIDRKHKGR